AENLVYTRVPLNAVAWSADREHTRLKQRHAAWHTNRVCPGARPQTKYRHLSCHGNRGAARRHSCRIAGQQMCRNVVGKVCLHEAGKVRSFDCVSGGKGLSGLQLVVTAENEGVVLTDGETQRSPELVPSRNRDYPPANGIRRILEDVARRKFIVRVVLEQATVELVGSRFSGDLRQNRAIAAILRRVIVHRHSYFLNRVWVGRKFGTTSIRVVVHRSVVHIETVGRSTLAVGRDRRRVGRIENIVGSRTV